MKSHIYTMLLRGKNSYDKETDIYDGSVHGKLRLAPDSGDMLGFGGDEPHDEFIDHGFGRDLFAYAIKLYHLADKGMDSAQRAHDGSDSDHRFLCDHRGYLFEGKSA